MKSAPNLLTAMLMTFFLPGTGHLYLRYYVRGIAIIVLFWTGLAIVVIGFTGVDYRFKITEETILGFRVSPGMMRFYLAEIVIVYLYNFIDCIRLLSHSPDPQKLPNPVLYHLAITHPATPTKRHQRSISDTQVSLGRSTQATVRLDDPMVSRRHARIYQRDSDYVLEDLGSKNGTRVNGQPTRSHVLKSGDTIELGDCTVRFHS